MGNMSGQQIGGIAGFVVGLAAGYFIGPIGPALGASIGGAIGGLAGTLYDSAHPGEVVNEQESIADMTLQTSSYGQALPMVLGRGRLVGNLIDMGEKVEVENREESGGGGKGGGGPRQITITKTYTVSLAFALCDTQIFGEIEGLARIWVDNTLYYDQAQMSALPAGWTLYPGTSPQAPSPVFEAIHGVGNVPGYPYLCWVEIEDFDMGSNPRVPNFSFELYQAGSDLNGLTQLVRTPVSGDIWVAVPSLGQVWRYDDATRTRIATVALSLNPPLAVGFGFGMFVDSGGYVWATDPIAYAHHRIDPATNLITHTATEGISVIGNQVESGGYQWMGYLDYEAVTEDDDYVAYVRAYTTAGAAVLSYVQDFVAVRSWLRLAVTSYDGHIWTFSDQDDGNTSSAIHINQVTGDQGGNVGIGVDKTLKDILAGADGHLWVCNYTDGTIVRINPATMAIVTAVTTGAGPVQAGLASDGYIWVASTDRVVTRINPADNTSQSFQSGTPNVISPNNNIWAQGPSGAMWLVCTDDWMVQRFSTTGTTLSVQTGASPRAIVAGASNTVWVACASGDLHQITDAGVTNAPVSDGTSRLHDVMAAGLEAGGLVPADYDVTALPNPQILAVIVNVMAIRAILEQLAIAHNFQLVESNRQLVFKRRGQEAIRATIPEADLDARASQGETPGLAITRLQEAELPTTLSLSYMSPTRNYQQNTQMAFVSNSQAPTENGRAMSTSIGLSDLEGKQRAQELLDRIWVERNSYSLKVGRKYAYLEPMDRVQVTSRGVTHTLTLTEASYGRPGILELQGKSDSAATQYVRGALPGSVPAGTQQIGYLAHTTARLLNLPALGNTDQTARYFVAYENPNSGWPGATLHRSPDGGASYQLKHAGIIKGITGAVAVALADADWHFLDEVSTFTVVLVSGTLSSISDTALYNGGNVCMIGSELLAFATATLTGVRTYQCSRLLRGRRGTEWAVSSHGVNEQFAYIDGGVYKIEHDLAERNYTVPFKSVTNGLLISTVTAQNFAPTDENLVPWQIFPADDRDTGTGDWTISWVLRSRFFGDWVDLDGVGYDPDHIGFRIVVYSDGTFTTIKRTTDTDGGLPLDPEATKTWVYTSAMQVTDFGSNQTTIYYKAYQIASGGVSYATATTGV